MPKIAERLCWSVSRKTVRFRVLLSEGCEFRESEARRCGKGGGTEVRKPLLRVRVQAPNWVAPQSSARGCVPPPGISCPQPAAVSSRGQVLAWMAANLTPACGSASSCLWGRMASPFPHLSNVTWLSRWHNLGWDLMQKGNPRAPIPRIDHGRGW